MLHANPIDGAIGHVVDQNVVGVSERRQNRLRVLEKRRVPVVCVASEESVQVLEAQPAWPLVEGAIRTLQPVGNQVVLAEPRRVLPIADKNVSDGAGALRKDRVVTRISGCKLRDVAEADAVVVATGQESGPRR